ncbi:MAG: type II toxin-antitoxin system PemK/MazF family toxin [Flavobacteriales bacterium]
MKNKTNNIWLSNLEPRFGIETGKIRPVLIVQTDILNNIHPSTLICPITINVKTKSKILRIYLDKELTKLKENCDVMIDQLRAIDNKRLIKKLANYRKS